jgi:cellulose synthase/poly-beta-1,6-N-acetylglucosamine synthase-like glycosyltransferase
MSELLLEFLGLLLWMLHFSVPLTYFTYLRRYARRPWNVKADKQYKPQLTVILPTYNESELIEKRLENLVTQDYPTNKVEIVVVDSASTDGTAAIVEDWLSRSKGINAKLIRESSRGGKFRALTYAMKAIRPTSEAIVLTDADAYWEPNALSEVTSFLADPRVGAVTGTIFYVEDQGALGEDTYRNYYNAVHVAESKLHSTAVFNGPLLAIRTELLHKIGFPNFPGSDDSAFGSFVAFAGYRAIQVDTAVVREYVRGSQLRRRVRRATCLLLNFHNTKHYAKKMNLYVRSDFDNIWRTEWWLCVVNPWLLLASVALLVVGAILDGSKIASALLAVNALLLLLRPYRTWVLQQLYLILGAFRNLWTNEEVWNR